MTTTLLGFFPLELTFWLVYFVVVVIVFMQTKNALAALNNTCLVDFQSYLPKSLNRKGKIFFFLIYFWLRWVFVAACGLSLVAASRGYSSLRCVGFSLWWFLLLWSTGSKHLGSVVVAHGLSCSGACGIFPDQGSNPCPLRWQPDS